MKKIQIVIIILCLFIFKTISAEFFLSQKTSFCYDIIRGTQPAIKKIDATNYLLAYSGNGNKGNAVILQVDVNAPVITKKTPLLFDNNMGSAGGESALVKIDNTNFLLAYRGLNDKGYAVILTVNITSGTITQKTPLTFDNDTGREPALIKINDTNYLLAYRGDDSDGWAVILTVNVATGIITKKTPFEYDANNGVTPSLEKIDDINFLVAYSGAGNDGTSAILKVNITDGTITKGTPFIFDSTQGLIPSVVKMNDVNYLVVYRNQAGDGAAEILIADTDLMTVEQQTYFVYEAQGGYNPSVVKIDNENYFVAYANVDNSGAATPLNADALNGAIGLGPKIVFDPTHGLEPSLENVDSKNYIVAYRGIAEDGWVTLLGLTKKIYLKSGTFTSSVKDAGQAAHWKKLNWKDDVPDKTNIKFQVRSGNANPPVENFTGPDNTPSTYFTDPDGPYGDGNDLGVMDNQFFQYKAYFSASDSTLTPKLYNATVTFSINQPNANFKTYIYKWEENFK